LQQYKNPRFAPGVFYLRLTDTEQAVYRKKLFAAVQRPVAGMPGKTYNCFRREAVNLEKTDMKSLVRIIGLFAVAAGTLSADRSYACSRVLYADNGQAVVVGRNLDWPDTFKGTDLWLFPRGITRDGLASGKRSRGRRNMPVWWRPPISPPAKALSATA